MARSSASPRAWGRCRRAVTTGLAAAALALEQVGAPGARQTSTGAGVRIGIVDTGVDAGHPDLAGKVDAPATCVGGPCREGSAAVGEGLGTAVAGLAAAAAGNGIGIAGVAGALALLLTRGLTPSAAVQRLLATADRSLPCDAGRPEGALDPTVAGAAVVLACASALGTLGTWRWRAGRGRWSPSIRSGSRQ